MEEEEEEEESFFLANRGVCVCVVVVGGGGTGDTSLGALLAEGNDFWCLKGEEEEEEVG